MSYLLPHHSDAPTPTTHSSTAPTVLDGKKKSNYKGRKPGSKNKPKNTRATVEPNSLVEKAAMIIETKRKTPAAEQKRTGPLTLSKSEILIAENLNMGLAFKGTDFSTEGVSINDLVMRGERNVYNTLATGIAARIFDIKKDALRESLTDFAGVEHRLEFVAKLNGVEYINDSKSTNVNAAWYSLESMTKRTIWIAGGVDKGNDYEVLLPSVKRNVRAIIAIGVNNMQIKDFFAKHVDTIISVTTMEDAVYFSQLLAQKGDAVLLSPSCSSFDLFENYEDRGNQFKKEVRAL